MAQVTDGDRPTLSSFPAFALLYTLAIVLELGEQWIDPWFTGGSLNYYYGGWLLLSIPARLARTSPSTVMNLAPALMATCSERATPSLMVVRK